MRIVMAKGAQKPPENGGSPAAFAGRSEAATFIIRACFDWPSATARKPRLHFTLEDIQSGASARFADFDPLIDQLRARIKATAAAHSITPNS